MKKAALWGWLLLVFGDSTFGQNVRLTGQISHLNAAELACSLLPLTLTAKPTKSLIAVYQGGFQREFALGGLPTLY